MATLTVGAGQAYATIEAAVAASHAGDTVAVQAGTYTDDFVSITHSLTLKAVGGTVKMVASVAPPNGKGIIDEGGAGVSVLIAGFDISGAVVGSGNGAGIRYEGGRLSLSGDAIHGNQDGLLANADPNGIITIARSTFSDNGAGDGYTHDIYVGGVKSLTVKDGTITDAVVGHDIKSRAASTTITGNTITDGPNGTASYQIDLPNGGAAVITGNTIEKGPNASNPVAISYGEEGGVYANSSLAVSGNAATSEDAAHATTFVQNDTSVVASLTGNMLFGWNTVLSGPGSVGAAGRSAHEAGWSRDLLSAASAPAFATDWRASSGPLARAPLWLAHEPAAVALPKPLSAS